MYTYVINWVRVWASAVFFYSENSYFGWNRLPQSTEELICDGIVLLILALSFSRERV